MLNEWCSVKFIGITFKQKISFKITYTQHRKTLTATVYINYINNSPNDGQAYELRLKTKKTLY